MRGTLVWRSIAAISIALLVEILPAWGQIGAWPFAGTPNPYNSLHSKEVCEALGGKLMFPEPRESPSRRGIEAFGGYGMLPSIEEATKNAQPPGDGAGGAVKDRANSGQRNVMTCVIARTPPPLIVPQSGNIYEGRLPPPFENERRGIIAAPVPEYPWSPRARPAE